MSTKKQNVKQIQELMGLEKYANFVIGHERVQEQVWSMCMLSKPLSLAYSSCHADTVQEGKGLESMFKI